MSTTITATEARALASIVERERRAETFHVRSSGALGLRVLAERLDGTAQEYRAEGPVARKVGDAKGPIRRVA